MILSRLTLLLCGLYALSAIYYGVLTYRANPEHVKTTHALLIGSIVTGLYWPILYRNPP